MKIIVMLALLLSACMLFAQTPPPAAAPQPPPAAAPQAAPEAAPQSAPPAQPEISPQLKQAQELNRDGKQAEALAILTTMLATDPDNYEVNISAGSVLDLMGDYDKARTYLKHAIEVAPTDRRVQSLRTMAVSYAFQCDMQKVLNFEQLAAETQMNAQKLTDAAGIYNELARIYLECGDAASANKWYQTGYQTAVKSLNVPEADRDLWSFRWQSAKARVAAREGKAAEANTDLTAAKALLDAGKVPANQKVFYPYLTGYLAFYAGNYKTAIEELQKADQKDPFILALLAQAYEKSGNNDEAMKLYRQILTINAHNPTNAFARPLAKKKLGMTS